MPKYRAGVARQVTTAKQSNAARRNIARAHVARIRRKEPRRVGTVRRLRTRRR